MHTHTSETVTPCTETLIYATQKGIVWSAKTIHAEEEGLIYQVFIHKFMQSCYKYLLSKRNSPREESNRQSSYYHQAFS